VFKDDGLVLKPQTREVVFWDTCDFRLYNHAFILRRRIAYKDGFPTGEPEIVFKYRNPDLQRPRSWICGRTLPATARKVLM
jgi:hypothetical protein